MKATTLLVFVALGLMACHAMARPTQHRASPRVNVAPKAVQKIAVAGSGYYTNVAALLRERLPGVQVDTYASAPSGAVVSTYDTIVLLRVNGNVDIINYVKNGGRLVTEWSAGGWAVDTAQLLGATRTNHSGYVGSATPITFLAPGQGLSQGVHNPYTDDGRTEYFYSFNIDNQVATIQGTITRSNFDMQPVFLTGVSQKGCVVILGDDWSDSFGSANADTQQLVVNAVQFVCDSYENSCLTDCCNAHSTSKCEDEGISQCVCGHSGFQSCCTTEWTQSCANAVQQFGCGDCKTAGSCCIAHSDGGCINRNTTSCVCAVDSTCCTGVWDAHCVQLVQSHNCAECHADCCLAHNSPGCTENSIQKCVCSIQPFCCDVVWDSFCVEAVEKYSCGSCCS